MTAINVNRVASLLTPEQAETLLMLGDTLAANTIRDLTKQVCTKSTELGQEAAEEVQARIDELKAVRMAFASAVMKADSHE